MIWISERMVDQEKEIALMLKVKEGDVQAFEDLYNKFKDPITNFFYHLTWDYATSEDYLQAVFIRLWQNAKNYRPIGKFSTYIFQIAKNYWLNEQKRLKRRPKTVSLEGKKKSTESHARKIELGDEVNNPIVVALQKELEGEVKKAIDALSNDHRVVFILSEFQDLKYKEISEILEIPVGTVKSRMANTERQLRKKLTKYLE